MVDALLRTCLLLALLIVSCAPPAGSASPPSSTPTTAQASIDIQGSGDKKTATFTVSKDWFVGWAYDCRQGLARNGVVPSGAHCTFTITVEQPNGRPSVENQPFSQAGAEGQGVLVFHTGGTFYLQIEICCTDGNTWTIRAGALQPNG